jgi:hypothetical protein
MLRFMVQALQDPPLCGSTVLTKDEQIMGKQQGTAKEHKREGNSKMEKNSLQEEGRRSSGCTY